MGGYLASVWRCRYFWISLVKMDLRNRYRRSVLGVGWSLLHPLIMTAIMCTVFQRILHAPMPDYVIKVLAGLACWNFILFTTIQGCQCLFHGEVYIRQYPAPAAIYPLRVALGALIHFLLALAVVIAVTWYFKGFDNWMVLPSLVPAVFLLFVLGWALAVLAGFANVYFKDTQHLCDVGFQIFFYATPIIYDPSDLGGGRLSHIVQWNPLVPVLKLFRDPILEGRLPGLTTLGAAASVVTLLAVCAVMPLWRFQKTFIFRM
jgi:ABC-type polysaccharide/polyol phosphate export permease